MTRLEDFIVKWVSVILLVVFAVVAFFIIWGATGASAAETPNITASVVCTPAVNSTGGTITWSVQNAPKTHYEVEIDQNASAGPVDRTYPDQASGSLSLAYETTWVDTTVMYNYTGQGTNSPNMSQVRYDVRTNCVWPSTAPPAHYVAASPYKAPDYSFTYGNPTPSRTTVPAPSPVVAAVVPVTPVISPTNAIKPVTSTYTPVKVSEIAPVATEAPAPSDITKPKSETVAMQPFTPVDGTHTALVKMAKITGLILILLVSFIIAVKIKARRNV